MPNVTISKNDLLKLAGKNIPTEKLLDRIAMMGTSVEAAEGDSITVETFPNRPDLLCTEGLARALSSFIGHKVGLRKYKAEKSNYTCNVETKKVKNIRPYAVAAVVKGIKLDEPTILSIMQLQEKLHETHGRRRKKVSIGVYDLDTLKFPLTYTTRPADFKFTPLEMEEKLTLRQILQRHPKGMGYAHLLEGFTEYPIWIDKNGQVLSMPPIINSNETRVTQKTNNLFIDVTGLEEKAVEQALNVLITALADRGGKVYSVKVGNKGYPNLSPWKIKLDFGYANKLLGLNLKKADLKKYLERMGFGVEGNKVLVPSYRTDILHQMDIVEDVAIAFGYENFKEEIPKVATVAEEDKLEVIRRKMANILTGMGLIETSTLHLSNKKVQCKKMDIEMPLVELANSVSAEHNAMRGWMIPSLMEMLSNNKHNEYPQKIFESGVIFQPDQKTETGTSEKTRLAVLLCDVKADYTKVRQVFDYLMRSIGIEYEIIEIEHKSFIPGRVGRILVKGKKVAYIGEIHPKVIENFSLDMPVAAFELSLTDLFEA